MRLGKLEKVDLRGYWKDEAKEFTPWLVKTENLQILADTLDIDIETEDTEVSVGNFKADILASDTHGRKIIIENQLEKTNHEHLGKIITYASGRGATIVIWICKSVTEEHRKAIDWLNEISEEGIDFFALEIELWKIDESSPAPKFNIVCSPNEWAKSVKGGARKPYSDTELIREEFWRGLKDYMLSKNTSVKPRKPRAQHWYDLAIGRSGFTISLTINTQRNMLSCELYIDNERAKEAFQMLIKQKEDIEQVIGSKLDWRELPNRHACRVLLTTPGDIKSRDNWNEYFMWFHEQTELFYEAFADRVKKLIL